MSEISLPKLISTRKEELARLLEYRGTDFPVVERQNDLRISFIELELEDLEKLNNQPQLNPNQQIVLDYLKEITIEDVSPMQAMEFLKYELKPNEYGGFQASTVGEAFYKLDNKEEAQVLKAFSQWALEQEEE